MSTVDDYVRAYANCKRISERVIAFQREAERFLYSMGVGVPSTVPVNWMSREELGKLLEEASIAWSRMNMHFESLPDDLKIYVVQPYGSLGAIDNQYRYSPPRPSIVRG